MNFLDVVGRSLLASLWMLSIWQVMPVYGGHIEISYRDPESGQDRWEWTAARFGTTGRQEAVSGFVVHARTRNGTNTACEPHVNAPSHGQWIALIERGNCKFTVKINTATVVHNASAVVIYNNRDDSTLAYMSHDVHDAIAVFISKPFGEKIANLVDANVFVQLNIFTADRPAATTVAPTTTTTTPTTTPPPPTSVTTTAATTTTTTTTKTTTPTKPPSTVKSTPNVVTTEKQISSTEGKGSTIPPAVDALVGGGDKACIDDCAHHRTLAITFGTLFGVVVLGIVLFAIYRIRSKRYWSKAVCTFSKLREDGTGIADLHT